MSPRHVALWVGLALVAARPTWGDAVAPYTAEVQADGAFVRSGPGFDYYPVVQLDRGARVDVFRHDPGGWLAVRPPAGSFCWVAAEFLEPVSPGMARVVADEVVVRVGTQFSDARDVIQVRLGAGDQVEVLGTSETTVGDRVQSWLKIAPPAGEFRWVAASAVAPIDAPTSDEPRTAERASWRLRPYGSAEPSDDAEATGGEELHAERDATDHTPPRDEPAPEPRAKWRRAAQPWTVLEAQSALRPAESFERRWPGAGRGASQASRDRQGPRGVGDVSRELTDLNLELSRRVSEPSAGWQFDDLLRRADEAIHGAESPELRRDARELQGRIERFAQLQERGNRDAEALALAGRALPQPPDWAREAAPDERREPTRLGEYDGVGRLIRVENRRAGDPRYALVDEQGRIRSYVTPSPNLNLRHYLGRDVGIYGMRGVAPELDAPHITAKQVTVAGDSLRR